MSHKRYKSKTLVSGNDFSYVAIHTSLPPYELAWHFDTKLFLPFRCEPLPFKFYATEFVSKHVLYYFEGDEHRPRTWLISNNGTKLSIINQKPIPDYLVIWETDEDFPMEEFWISRLKEESLVQMVYLYPQELTTKFRWCFDLPYLIPNKADV